MSTCLGMFQFPACPAGGAAVVLQFTSSHAEHSACLFFSSELRKFHISGLKQKSQKRDSQIDADINEQFRAAYDCGSGRITYTTIVCDQ